VLDQASAREGVGGRLADDLAGTGSKPGRLTGPEETLVSDFIAGFRQIAGKPSSHGLRPESEEKSSEDLEDRIICRSKNTPTNRGVFFLHYGVQP